LSYRRTGHPNKFQTPSQTIIKDMGIRCKRPKLELEDGTDYDDGKKKVKNYKQIASALKNKESDVGI